MEKKSTEIMKDVAARKSTVQTPEEREALYLAAIAAARGVSYHRDFHDETKQWQFLSDGIEELTGYSKEELTVELWESLIQERVFVGDTKGVSSAAEAFQKILSGELENYHVHFRITTRQGEEKWVFNAAKAVFNPQGELSGLFGIAFDITKEKKAEKEMIRIERLRALGELSAGISHNLNNILQGILGPALLLKMKTHDPELMVEVDEIIASGMRAKDLVHRLHLSTQDREGGNIHPVHITPIVYTAIQRTRARWKDEPEAKGITIEVVSHLEDVPPIKANESELDDIIINFLFNAVDAMAEGGTITIETQRVADDVLLTFSDTGTGMDAETQERIFEPFFTTKADVGTGLGLSTVYNTVIKWGGKIEVKSEVGTGTTFTLQFPVLAEPEIPEEEPTEVLQVRPGKILIVDDDGTVTKFLFRFLSRYHEVETISDGQKALEAFAPGQYDIALIDLGLPKLPGDRVGTEIRRIDPCLATVLITGWELQEDDPRLSVFDFKMKKPFTDIDHVLHTIALAIELHDTRVEEKE